MSGTRNCHAQNGRCDCKNHVIGKKCQNCRDGYHGMKSHDIFGCKGEALILLSVWRLTKLNVDLNTDRGPLRIIAF